jgi:transcriptional regulator with XRE-family HTH domain
VKLRGLRQARQRRGLSISQLAEITDLRRDTITHLEHGKEEPQPYVLRRLAAALSATTSDLLGVTTIDSINPINPINPIDSSPKGVALPLQGRHPAVAS